MLATCALWVLAAPHADGRTISGYAPLAGGPGSRAAAPSAGSSATASATVHRPSPTAPVQPGGFPPAGAGDGGDPLVANGLGSVLCRSPRLQRSLSSELQANCRASGVAVAPAPISHYAFDVHIDTGLTGLNGAGFDAAVQDLILTPVWTALLWLIHAVIVGLEWCYSVDLLDSATLGPIVRGLQSTQREVTGPLLPAVLAVAAIVFTYQGLIRRRVTDTALGATAMLAMMVAGLWLIADPQGTLGQLNRLVNDAALGTVAAVSSGSTRAPEDAFGNGLQGVFVSVVQAPWCYLEFGDVDWCRNPRRLDPDLRRAASRLAATSANGACPAPRVGVACGAQANGSRPDQLRRATDNGSIFLAFAANGPERNSINDAQSLLRVICRADDATRCQGAAAAQASFRTAGSTWSRAGGLLFIAIGALGMIALLAFVALRLLGATLLGVLYLLLAPVAVLAPPLGEGGRRAFGAWATRLLGAVVAKLIYSVFLGVVLLIFGVLTSLGSLGWWTQWLLIAAFWWAVFTNRHQVLEYATLGHRDTGMRGARVAAKMVTRQQARGRGSSGSISSLLRGAGERIGRAPQRGTPGAVAGAKRGGSTPTPGRAHLDPGGGGDRADLRHRQVAATLEQDYRDALADRRALGTTELNGARARVARLDREIAGARADGDRRRELRLQARRERQVHELSELAQRAGASPGAPPADRRPSPRSPTPDERERRGRTLDQQILLKRGLPASGPGSADHRDYPMLAGLAGVGRHQYEQARSSDQRKLRLAIDRQLERRRQAGTPGSAAAGTSGPTGSREQPTGAESAPRHAPTRRLSLGPRARQFGRQPKTPRARQ